MVTACRRSADDFEPGSRLFDYQWLVKFAPPKLLCG